MPLLKIVFIYILFFLSIHISARAQSFELGGYVYDSENIPVEDAIVVLSSSSGYKFTDGNGYFSFNDLKGETYILQVHRLGYEEIKRKVQITQDTVIAFHLALSPELEEVVVQDRFLGSEIVTLFRSELTELEIQQTQGENLANVIERIPGVNTLRTGSRVSKPVIHGLHSSRLLILNNGLRHESQSWGQDHAPEIDPFLGKNLSVVKGASSVRYGANALSGVVLVEPDELPIGQQEVGGELNLVGMSNGRGGVVSGILESGLGTNWAWRVNGTLKRGGDLRAPDYFLTNTGFKEAGASVGLGYRKDRLSIDGFYSYFNTKLGILSATSASNNLESLDRAINTEPPARTEDSFSYDFANPSQEVTHHLFKLNGSYQGNFGRVKWIYGFQRNARKEFDVRRSSLSRIPSLNLQLSTQSLDVEYEKTSSSGFEYHLGATYLNQQNRNIPGTQRSNFIPNFNLNAIGAYAIANKHLGNIHLEAGLRYDYKTYSVVGFNSNVEDDFYRDTFDFGNFSGTLGAVVHINNNSSFSSNFGVAWRPPNMAELYSFGIKQTAGVLEYGLLWGFEGNTIDPNGTFGIQDFSGSGVESEVGYKWINNYILDNKDWRINASAYLNWIENYIYIRPEGVTIAQFGTLPYYFYDQTDALLTGLDLKLEYLGIKDIDLEARVDIVYAEDFRNDGALPLIPPPTFGLSARKKHSYSKRLSEFFYGISIQGSTRQFRAPRVIPPLEFENIVENDIDVFADDPTAFDFIPAPDGYALLGLESGLTFDSVWGNEMNIFLSVENLLNTEYRDYTNRLKYFADEPGINFTLRINYNF